MEQITTSYKDNFQPKLSIAMSVFNGEQYLGEAIESVLLQSFTNFELIIVNDGSTDGSGPLARTYAAKDPRIVILEQDNQGLPAGLNTACRAARSGLIVRMDADDLMMADRLERQLCFMDEHPDVSVGCSYALLIDSNGRTFAKSKPSVDLQRAWRAKNPDAFVNLIHAATIIRKEHLLAVGGYDASYRFAEDRELWGRLFTRGYKIAVQPEILHKSRLHSASMTVGPLRRNEITCQFIDHNIVRRMEGKANVSFDEFMRWRQSRSIMQKSRSWMRVSGAVFYKKATRHFAEKNWIRLALCAALAVALSPSRISQQIAGKLGTGYHPILAHTE
jgi:glycosyltransferase involved in cell wall biosynthesis